MAHFELTYLVGRVCRGIRSRWLPVISQLQTQASYWYLSCKKGLSVHSKYIHLTINLTVSEHQVERSVPPVATYWRLVPDNNLLNTFLSIDDVNHGILWKHISQPLRTSWQAPPAPPRPTSPPCSPSPCSTSRNLGRWGRNAKCTASSSRLCLRSTTRIWGWCSFIVWLAIIWQIIIVANGGHLNPLM